ncbi:MAG: hypothetical protein D6734_00985 [Candidatus Schekmanbacteria bacterium]|nr:MAG: hypothetical protein D6734_00985 [Candidatus Schekmanbacteria bacterium]
MKAIPYFDEILDGIKPMNPVEMKEYKGNDISEFRKIETDMMTQEIICYSADKIDKIVTMKSTILGGKLIVWATNIVPSDEYDLPIFSSELVQGSHISLRVDLIPTADCGRDINYLKKYVEPIQPLWEKYKDIEGMCLERYLWFRVMLSPFYTCGKFKYEQEGIEDKCLEITKDYLNLYVKFWQEAEKQNSEYMKSLVERKRKMFETLRENDPGGGPLKKALGEEKAEIILSLLF